MTQHVISPQTLQQWLKNDIAILVDVREADEFAEWHIPQARSLPLSKLDLQISGLQYETRKIVFQCLKGKRGEKAYIAASQFLRGKEIYNLEGGIEAWEAEGLPIIR